MGTNNCFYFQDPSTESKIIRILQNNLGSKISCIISKRFVKDITSEQEQQNKIKYHHNVKLNHKGLKATSNSLLKYYYWPNLVMNISTYINSCETCQTAKTDRHPPHIKYQITSTPVKPLEVINIDTLQIKGLKILTIIDIFSKIGHAYPIETISGMEVMRKILTFIQHYGFPNKIICDSGIEFNNALLQDFCNLHKIKLHFTSIQGHTSSGNIERFHSTILDSVRCLS